MNDHHLVILASAGTGKTFQLTNRFIRLLAAGVDPSAILATTFTRKAAGEILERILSRLAAAAVEERALEELQQHVDRSLTHERARELTVQVVSSIHRLNVKTLDSFFAWMTGCFGLEMGIAPGWRIVDEQEDAALREESIQQALREADREELIRFLEMLNEGASTRTIHSAVERAVESAYAAYVESAGRPEAWEVFGPRSTPLGDDALRHGIETLSRAEMPPTRSGQPDRRWQKAHDGNLLCAEAGDWEGFLARGLAAKIIQKDPVFYKQSIPPEIIAAYDPLIQHASAVRLSDLQRSNIAVRELMARFDRIYQRCKEETGAWRFEDVPRRLLEQPLDGRLDHLYYRLDARIQHVLLDEFQDTSLEQFSLIEPILDELLSDGEAMRSLFIVGDVKQSLYSWRGAEPELLPNLVRRWNHLQQDTLERNFRSSPIILETVNQVFEHLASNPALSEFGGIAQRWQKRYKPHLAGRTTMPGAARLLVAPSAGDDARRADQMQVTIDFAAERIASLLQQQPRTRVGVLVRTNRWIPEIIFALKQRGIPASEEGGNPLTDSPPVAVAISLLQLADHPGDSAATFHVATSPLGSAVGLTDPLDLRSARTVAAEVRHRLMRDGYAEYLRSLLLRCISAMDSRGAARFEQLIDLAQQFDARAGSRPSDFVRMVQEQGVEEPGRQNVSVMTVHQAKGLEFDAVVLPELDRRWQLRPDQVLTDRRNAEGDRTPFAPVTAVTRYPGADLRMLHPGLEDLHRHWQERQISEELCCLYVALTRAVHVLEMIVPPPSERESNLPLCSAGLLRGALAPGATAEPGTQIWEQSSGADSEWVSHIEARSSGRAATKAETSPAAITLALPREVPTGRLRRRSPSSLEGGERVDLGMIWSISGDSARDRGSLMHAWFESIEWLDDDLPADESLLAHAPALGFAPQAARDLLEAFKASLRGEIAGALKRTSYTDRPAAALEVRREHPFAVRDVDAQTGRACLLTGIFDRLVIGWVISEDGRKTPLWADILDFKTDRIAPGDRGSLEHRVELYTPQIRAYRRAIAQVLGLEQSQITARLLFTEAGVCCEVE